MLLNTLDAQTSPPTGKNDPAPNVYDAEVRRRALGIR